MLEAMSIGVCISNSIIGVMFLSSSITNKSLIIGIIYSLISVATIWHTGILLDKNDRFKNNLKK
jgi:hypothetical protein